MIMVSVGVHSRFTSLNSEETVAFLWDPAALALTFFRLLQKYHCKNVSNGLA